MRNFSIRLLAVVLLGSLSVQTLAQDISPPRESIATPSRFESTQDVESSDQDSSPQRLGVMGEATDDYVVIENAFAQLIDDVEIPAEETGKLTDIYIERGDTVAENNIVAKIDSLRAQRIFDEAQLKFNQASLRAKDPTAVRAAKSKLKLAAEEFDDTKRLFQLGSKSKTLYMRAEYSRDIAMLEVMAAENENALAIIESKTQNVAVNAAKDSLARHELKSSLDGIVFEVLKDKGEWVQAGEPVVRVARMDKLRIQGSVDSKMYNPPQIDGCRVTAKVNLAGGRVEEFTGKVTFVSSEYFGDTFHIDAVIENRKYTTNDKHWILRAGADLSVTIHFDKTQN